MRECSHLLSSRLRLAEILAAAPSVDNMSDPQGPMAPAFAVRDAGEGDWPQIWPVIRDVVTEQQTFAYDPL